MWGCYHFLCIQSKQRRAESNPFLRGQSMHVLVRSSVGIGVRISGVIFILGAEPRKRS